MRDVQKRCYGETSVSDCIKSIFARNHYNFYESEKYVFDQFRRPGYHKEGVLDITSLQQPGVYSEFFEKEIEYYERYGAKMWPAVVINNQTYRGQLEVEAVMNAICAGFAEPPTMCKRVLESGDMEDATIIFGFDEDIVPMHHVLGVILFTMLTVTCVLCIYRRHAKR